MLRTYTGVGYYLICLPVWTSSLPVDRGASGEADNCIGLSMKAQLVLRRADRFVCISNIIILILSLINRCGCKLSFRCEGQPDVPEYTVQMQMKFPLKMLTKVWLTISNAASIGAPIEVKHTIKHICGQF